MCDLLTSILIIFEKKNNVFENAFKKRKKMNTGELTVDALVYAPKFPSAPPPPPLHPLLSPFIQLSQ